MSGVVICADDFGLTEGVSRGILELAEAGRISATGAIVTRPAWAARAADLRSLAGRIGIGLHLNLTTGAPLGAMPTIAPSGALPRVDELLQRAFSGRLLASEIRAEVDRQLDAFGAAFGAPPAFIDGHQHVHVLPIVRAALLSALGRRGLAGKLWLRDPSDGIVPILRREVSADKALFVKALAIGFRRRVRAAGFATNEGFSGFGPFDPAVPAQRVIGQALLDLGPRPVVMVHPGHPDAELAALDRAVESRAQELAYLASEEFADLLAARTLALVPAPAPRPGIREEA